MTGLPDNMRIIQPEVFDHGRIIVLDAIAPGFTPDYCVHGNTTCTGPGCDNWCYLGTESYRLVSTGYARPLCHACATALLDPEKVQSLGNVHDHRWADGPHPH